MASKEINQLIKRVDDIEIKFENSDIDDIGNDEYENYVLEVFELEKNISEHMEYAKYFHLSQLKKLQKRIVELKRTNNFYDAEAELDNMFPNRYDDDFDEDSMSYDSVFGSE